MFIYYEKNIMVEGSFHSVKFSALSRLLEPLGSQEGVVIYHVLGHKEASVNH